MSKRPYILVTNDDGITAPGIQALYRSMQELGDVVVVAPDKEMSAAGHAITLTEPIRTKEVELPGDIIGHAVTGTPADCVKIAVKAILDRKPDLVVSGINLGSNTGVNVLYSGTVSAATEGVILGIPGLAFSLTTYNTSDYQAASHVAKYLTRSVLENGLPENTGLNVNIPPISLDEIKGIRVTKQGKGSFNERFEKRLDPRQKTYYWMTGEPLEIEEDEDADGRVIREGYISVTPIQYDLTHYQFLETLKEWSTFSNGQFNTSEHQ